MHHPRKLRLRLVVWGCLGWLLGASAALQASLEHTPLFSHIKTMMNAYGRNPVPPEWIEFINTHYDVTKGTEGGNGALLTPLTFAYTNYYCTYVGNPEYLDAQAWAAAHGDDFEAYFIHYAEPTTLHPYGGQTYTLPAGSRVPTYSWYNSAGDMNAKGARVVCNVGNPAYRAWKLDYVKRLMAADGSDGAFVDNTRTYGGISGAFTIVSGGTIAEHPVDFGTNYGNAVLTMLIEGHAVGIPQLANMAGVDDPRVYPYLWGIYREFALQPAGVTYLPWIDNNIAAASAAGLQNLIGSYWPEARYDMPGLAMFYILADSSCYFFPFLCYVYDGWDIDPRLNQWFGAVAFDVGPRLGPRYVISTGPEPSAPHETMTAVVTRPISTLYRLTDTTKAWSVNQWQNKSVLFPGGFSMQVYRSGENWIDLYNPAQVPVNGTYQVAAALYTIYARDYEHALVLWRPKASSTTDITEASAVPVTLPETMQPLAADGTLGAAVSAVSMRNTDGLVLAKETIVPVKADFTANPTEGEAPLDVSFTDASTGAPTAWAWAFGDGAVANMQHPSHIFTAPGSYTVSLTATNASSSDTLTRPDYLTVTAPPPPPPPPGDTEPPAVRIDAPADGQTVTGVISVRVTATDNLGVLQVLLFLDGKQIGADSSTPYSFRTNTKKWSTGVHVLTAQAYDAAGNAGQAQITVRKQ